MTTANELFDRSSAAGRLMADLDWSATPIGDPAGWPQSLRGQVRTVLSSRYPMLLLWGEQFTQLYNDAYSALIGDQHPAAMGGDVRVTLAEGWPVLGPIIDEAMRTGVASWVPALQLLLERAGYREEAWFSVSHAPARDDEGTTRGVLTVCSEVTEQVVGERRLRLLRDLSLQSDHSVAVDVTCRRLVDAVREHPLDVPFAGLYLREGDVLRLAAGSGTDLPSTVSLGEDDPWGLAAAGRGTTTSGTVPLDVVGGAWGDPVTESLALPLPSADRARPLGVLLCGVSPSRALDEPYRSFFELLAQQVSVALRNARAYEDERARAEALAELDRVKTGFFTNVSHEFRTPLTLMLGPLHDALADDLAPLQRDRVETAARASQRLLKLVNDLLTFSSLEAGREGATVRALDLAAATADVASSFRAAVERAGLTLDVDCPPLPRPVALDPDHWEKVVGNLLSNALKFTFTGGIVVRLVDEAEHVRLEVADTGVGIAAEELPRLFDRFHRVSGTRSRSHEGSGIGLALVRELTALSGGTVEVESEVGAGTCFVVWLPWSVLEQPAAPVDRPAGASVQAAVAEAASWTAPPAPAEPVVGATSARVLVADDNADMRDYLARLLGEQGWSVETVADGAAALEAVRREPPDLLLTDVMMPELDGFDLVRALRADERTATLPIVVLSARAGEEASAEGLGTGADDYVVKPFSSADLVARLRTTMRLASQRSRHVQQLGALADAAAVISSGQQLEQALRTMTEQVRSLLGARGVSIELVRDDGRPGLLFAAGDEAEGARDVVELPLTGSSGRQLGRVRVLLDPDEAVRVEAHALLRPLTRVLTAVAERSWDVDRDSQVAATLQRHLLPDGLPTLPGVELAARYLPAERDVQVGGDWYDVLALPDGDVAISVGDVAGHGLTAALVMGQLRAAVRAYSLEGLQPAEAVLRLDELVSRLPGASISTLFLGRLDLATGALTWCSAGHPPPVLVAPGHEPSWLEGEVSPPLGAGLSDGPVETTTALPEDGRLVLYTDGLVEDRRTQLDEGMPALLARVAAARTSTADGLVRAVVGGSGTAREDDVAVLVVHRTAARAVATVVRDVELDLVLDADPTAAGRMRREVRSALREAGLDDDASFELLLAASEAVNNAVEHAVDPSVPEVHVRLVVESEGARVRLQVRDFGTWRERRPSMDRGRGSALMTAGGQVQVVPTGEGTVVTIERDLSG